MRSIFRVKFDRIPADEVEHLHGDTMNEMIPLTVANTLNQTMKNRIEAKPNQSLRQVIQNQNLAPKGEFDVYDQDGRVVSNEGVSNFRDRTVYVGVARVAGGGIPRERLKELKIEYPSMRPVKQHLTRKEAQMIRVRFPSNSRTRSGFWDIVIYCPNASSSLMHTYVLNFDEITQRPESLSLSTTSFCRLCPGGREWNDSWLKSSRTLGLSWTNSSALESAWK